LRLEVELLSANRGFVHQAFLAHGEHHDAVLVLGVGAFARGCGDSGRLRGESELAGLEVIQRSLVFKQDQLAVLLAAELEADRRLREVTVADQATLLVYVASAIRAANSRAALGDLWKHGVSIRLVNVPGDRWVAG